MRFLKRLFGGATSPDTSNTVPVSGAVPHDRIPAPDGYTPLHEAAIHGDRLFAEKLLAKNADINALTNDGRTPLHIAARTGQLPMVELLLAHKAQVNCKTQSGHTPLQLAAAARNGWYGERTYKAVVEMLLAAGADVNAKDN